MSRRFTVPIFIINIIDSAYEKIFQEKMSDDVKIFLKKFAYIAAGTSIAAVFTIIFHILGGRALGPVEYGKFTLIQSVAMFLYIPMLLGLGTAMIKYSSEKEDFDRQSKITSTTYILTGLLTITSAIVYFIFSSQISTMFSVPSTLFRLSIIFAALFTFYTLSVNTLRGLYKMRTYAIFQPVFGIILLSAFALLLFAGHMQSFKSMLYASFFTYGITGTTLIVFFLRKYLRLKFDTSWVNILTTYSMFAVINQLSHVFYSNIDKILIGRYMTIADVGIYKAYYMASIDILTLITGMVITIYFPTASKYKTKQGIFNQLDKLIPYLIGIGFPFILICELIILKLYGGGYPIDLRLMLLFALSSILIMWHALYAWTFSSEGTKGISLNMISVVTIAIINVLLNIYLIPRFGLYGAVESTAASFTIGILCLYVLRRRIT